MRTQDALLVTDDDSIRRDVSRVADTLGCQLRSGECSRWHQDLTGQSPNPKWVFVDLRSEAHWNSQSILLEARDRLVRRGGALVGLHDQAGYSIRRLTTATELLDGSMEVPLRDEEFRGVADRLGGARQRTIPSNGMPYEKVLATRDYEFVTRTPALYTLLEQVEVAALNDVTILLVGETGVGKTTLARIIHQLSNRDGEPFVNVACGTLPNDLIDSELFGHVKGSFTSAECNKEGKFTAAKKGTILLDEVDVLGMPQQAKLLRVLESGEYEPIGSNDTRHVQARVIVAANFDLEALIAREQFRPDLYYRLSQLKFEIPPLRNRPADIIPLAMHFMEESSCKHGTPVRHCHPDFLAALQAYSWPGNMRELRNEISRAVMFARDGVLDLNMLSPKISQAPMPLGVANSRLGLCGEVATTEQAAIERMLQAHNFNRSATARALGISRVTLYNKIRKYRIRVEDRRSNGS